MAEESEDRLENENQAKRSESSEAKSNSKSEGPPGGGQKPSANQASVGVDTAQVRREAESESQGEDRSARMNAAKAFYRAMYAGEDVVPDDFGVGGGQSARTEGARSCSNCDSMQQQMSQIEARANEVENLYKRMAADFDNFRKRTEREKEELLGLGAQRAVETMLPAVDDLDRAQGSFTSESEAKTILESLKLIYTRFSKCLEQMGVKAMDVVGQPFDPKFHEPVQQIETNEQPEGAIVHDLRRGYLMRDKVIRPSLVNVAVHAPHQAEAAPPEQVEKVESEKKVEHEQERAIEAPHLHHMNNLASATAELPALDALASANELNLRSTHRATAEEVEKEAQERAQAEEKRAAKAEEEGPKSSENPAELAELSSGSDRQTSDD